MEKIFRKDKFVLEACIDSYASALAACAGGADRAELCANLIIGGTTPSGFLYKKIEDDCGLACNILIRPRFGDFCYNAVELSEIGAAVTMFRKLGAAGVVVGCLTPEGELNVPAMAKLRELAGPNMHFTLHRAFDMVRDPEETLRKAIELGIDTVLTSGKQNSALNGADLLRKLVKLAENKINILVGGGVSPVNIAELHQKTGATNYHMSGKMIIDSPMRYRNSKVNMGLPGLSEYEIWQTDTQKIKAAKAILAELAGKQGN